MSSDQNLTSLGKIVVFFVIAACLGGGWLLLKNKPGASTSIAEQSTEQKRETIESSDKVTVGIAYGTEKRQWLEWAVAEFAKTDSGKNISIDLIPTGSLDGARKVVAGDERINVWSPASSVYKEVFLEEWSLSNPGQSPIAKEDLLAISPMVFVGWKERMDAFESRYSQVTFDAIAKGLAAPSGWEEIAARPDWGFFKFGMTDPNRSNSGMLGLTLMAHHFHNKARPLSKGDVVDAEFQKWLRALAPAISGMTDSTGNLMREMILKGPSVYDCVVVYENLAIDYLKNAQGRWGDLAVYYPSLNIWNDNPYYVLSNSWTSPQERKAAESFLKFLLSKTAQERALVHGFRPADTSIAINGPDSPFTKYRANGIRLDIPRAVENPNADAVFELLTGWQRAR